MKILEGTTGENNFCDLAIGKDFLCMTQKSTHKKRKMTKIKPLLIKRHP